MYDHLKDNSYLEARIREAHRMRDEAIHQMFSAAWQQLRNVTGRIAHAVAAQFRSHHLLHH